MTEITSKDFAENLSAEDEVLVKALFEAGLHWGRSRSRTHPKMVPYIFSSRGEVQVIDLAKTVEALRAAEGFLSEVVRKGGTVMIVGTQPAAKSLVEEVGERLRIPFVHEKWLGGTLTNFKTFLLRLEHLRSLDEKIHSPEFEQYTKRERSQFSEEYKELNAKFRGIKNISRPPEVVFLLGVNRHETALREAKRRGIPVVAVVNTDDDPTSVEWPIPANDSATTSVKFLLNRFSEVIEKARVLGAEEKDAAKIEEAPAKSLA
ncbi:MAG: 30S ribosomal protein S2 [Parcubacteria group bacterium]|nr:30S ribosomal protein S2 [Parcubacteria group bacterium]